LTKAIEYKASLDMAYFNRGVAYYYTHEDDLAKADFIKVVQISTNTGLVEQVKKALTELGVDVSTIPSTK
jgi:hypothetical protein